MIRFLLLVIAISLYVTIVLICLLLGGFLKPYSKFNHMLFYYFSKIITVMAGIKLEVTGLENYDQKKGYILASNHSHLFDIPILGVATKLNMKFIAKKELFKIPVFGQVLHLIGMVRVDRGNSQKALDSLKKAQHVIEDFNVSISVFPEGTRSKTGKMLPFKKGAFMMSINTEALMLPVSIVGSNNILQGLKVVPQTIHVHVHPPVDPMQFGVERRNEFVQTVRELIVSKLETEV